MKKLSLVCMAALLIMAASCKKEEKNEKFDGGFRAKTETHAGDSKTQLVGQNVIWSEGDQITVFSEQSPNGQVFTATESGKNDVIFSADVDETYYSQSEFTSVYPDATKSGDNYQITLGATQAYTENGFASGANPMTAHSTNTTLNFKNVCGLLQLNLYSEATTTVKVKDITIYSNKTGEKLNGNGKLAIDAEGIPTLTNLDGGNALTLTCNVELSKNAESATPFFFVVPAGALSEGLEVVVTDENDAIWYRKTTSNCTITRSMITSLSPICVVPEICTEVRLWDGGPMWSTCNLGAEHPHYYGDYYAWGATSTLYSTQPAQTGTSTAVALPSGVSYGYNQYCPYRASGTTGPSSTWYRYTYGDDKYAANGGVVDNIYTLLAEDDAATADNSAWRMPTIDEFLELLSNTTQEWVEDYHHQGVKGYIIKGTGAFADNYIFLPAAGDIVGTARENANISVWYWTSSTTYDHHFDYGPAPYETYAIEKYNDGTGMGLHKSWSMRYVGFPIRAIKK